MALQNDVGKRHGPCQSVQRVFGNEPFLLHLERRPVRGKISRDREYSVGLAARFCQATPEYLKAVIFRD